jgi:sugar phosphate isomerase/epimerase
MTELAAQLGAPGIRVFGDRVQANTDRASTRGCIVESLNVLAEKISGSGVEVWLETHGDFSTASEVQSILKECPQIGLVWDAASAFAECGEGPIENGRALHRFIRHVHVKDLRRKNGRWSPALTGQGQFPLGDVCTLLAEISYDGFLSFEWEKKWHPEIEAPETAVPHFARWFRKNWVECGKHPSMPEIRP